MSALKILNTIVIKCCDHRLPSTVEEYVKKQLEEDNPGYEVCVYVIRIAGVSQRFSRLLEEVDVVMSILEYLVDEIYVCHHLLCRAMAYEVEQKKFAIKDERQLHEAYMSCAQRQLRKIFPLLNIHLLLEHVNGNNVQGISDLSREALLQKVTV